MGKFKKKPVVIEAIEWQGFNLAEVKGFVGREGVAYGYSNDDSISLWNSLEGCWVRCPKNHWIIKGIKGEFYPCAPKVFVETYEPVTNSEAL